MNIDDLSFKEIKQINNLFNSGVSKTQINKTDRLLNPYENFIGEKVFIRTVTFYYTGILREVFDNELVLEKVSWIADTGRFSDALKEKGFNEVEPFPDAPVIIGRGAVIDFSPLKIEIPLTQK